MLVMFMMPLIADVGAVTKPRQRRGAGKEVVIHELSKLEGETEKLKKKKRDI